MPTDRLLLEGLQFFGHHGDVEAERALGGRIDVDVEIRADLREASSTDDLAATIDYVRCYETVRRVVETRQHNLLETVAGEIADALLSEARVDSVRVRVAKQPPIAGVFHRFAVVVERRRHAAAR